MALNHARLPVPPLALAYALNLRKAVLSGCSGSIAAAQVAPDAANGVSGYWKQLSRKPFWIRFRISSRRCGLFLPVLVSRTVTLGEMTELDPVTPVAAAEEIVGALPEGIAQLAVIAGAGHFTWLDAPDRFWPTIIEFVHTTVGRERVQT